MTVGNGQWAVGSGCGYPVWLFLHCYKVQFCLAVGGTLVGGGWVSIQPTWLQCGT